MMNLDENRLEASRVLMRKKISLNKKPSRTLVPPTLLMGLLKTALTYDTVLRNVAKCGLFL